MHRQDVSQQQQPRFVYQPKPTYPLIARRRGWQGTVLLDLELLPNGTIGKIKVAISSGYPPLDAAARKAVGKWRHIPVQRNGTPITKQANLPIHFRLD
jgi:protein TonB